MPFEERIRELMMEARTELDAGRRADIFVEILRLYTENIYSVGLYEAQRGLGIAKRFRNVQPDVPPTCMTGWIKTFLCRLYGFLKNCSISRSSRNTSQRQKATRTGPGSKRQ